MKKLVRIRLMTLAWKIHRWLEPEEFAAQRRMAKSRREWSLRIKQPERECGISRVGKVGTTFRGKPGMVYEKTIRVATDHEGRGKAEFSRWRTVGTVADVATPLSWYAVGDERFVLGFDTRVH